METVICERIGCGWFLIASPHRRGAAQENGLYTLPGGRSQGTGCGHPWCDDTITYHVLPMRRMLAPHPGHPGGELCSSSLEGSTCAPALERHS